MAKINPKSAAKEGRRDYYEKAVRVVFHIEKIGGSVELVFGMATSSGIKDGKNVFRYADVMRTSNNRELKKALKYMFIKFVRNIEKEGGPLVLLKRMKYNEVLNSGWYFEEEDYEDIKKDLENIRRAANHARD